MDYDDADNLLLIGGTTNYHPISGATDGVNQPYLGVRTISNSNTANQWKWLLSLKRGAGSTAQGFVYCGFTPLINGVKYVVAIE